MRRKKHGDTVGEKILKKLDSMPSTGAVDIIGDVFFKEEIESGVKFYVRRGNFFRDEPSNDLTYGRFYDIPDEEALNKRKVEKEKVEEEARDKTFDEFMAMFENHLNGTAKPEDRTKNRPNTANDEEGKDAKTDKKKAEDDDKKSVNSKFGSVKSGAAKSGKSSIKTAS